MNSFKAHILLEKSKSTHALKYLEYEKDHLKHLNKIKSELTKAWTRISSAAIPAEEIEDTKRKIQPENKLTLVVGDAKVGRYGEKNVVQPSVKIGGLYSKNERVSFKESLLSAAKKILVKHASKLNLNISGNPFYVSQEDSTVGDIRLKFKTGDISKTILIVGVEPGNKFERVYLRDFLN